MSEKHVVKFHLIKFNIYPSFHFPLKLQAFLTKSCTTLYSRAKVPGYVKALYRQPTAKVPEPTGGRRTPMPKNTQTKTKLFWKMALLNRRMKMRSMTQTLIAPPKSTPAPASHPSLAALLTEYLATTADTPVQ